MDYESEVVNFLAQKENLPFALEIAEKITLVKNKLQKDFWECFLTRLKELLNDSDFKDSWMIKSGPDNLVSGFGIDIFPVTEPQSRFIYPRIEQYSGDLSILYGIVCSDEIKDEITVQIFSDFITKLKEEGYKKSDEWWPAYKYIDKNVRSNEFILEASRNFDVLVESIVVEFWEFFLQNVNFINNLNESIA